MNIFVQNTRTVEKNLTNLYIFGNLSKNNFINFYFKKNQNNLVTPLSYSNYKNGTEKKKLSLKTNFEITCLKQKFLNHPQIPQICC